MSTPIINSGSGIEVLNLLPCPFCGSNSVEESVTWDDRSSFQGVEICCECGGRGEEFAYTENGRTEAASAWNKRAYATQDELSEAVFEHVSKLPLKEGLDFIHAIEARYLSHGAPLGYKRTTSGPNYVVDTSWQPMSLGPSNVSPTQVEILLNGHLA